MSTCVFSDQLTKVLVEVADIIIDMLMKPEEGEAKWNEFIAPVTQVLDVLKGKSKLSSVDVCKMGACALVSWKAQGKVNRGLGKLYSGAKAKALAYAKNSSMATPQQFLGTPEGLLFKAARGSENNNFEKLKDSLISAKNEARFVLRVKNMPEFLKTTEFGKYLDKVSEKTGRTWKDHMIYEVKEKIKNPNLRRGDYFYLDKTHLDHIEVFDNNGLAKCVLNLDGTINEVKTDLARGRNIKSSIK